MWTDKRLERRAREGDERAFAAIFRRYHQDLYRFCLGILRTPEDAQDALQNTMVAALRSLPGETREIELKPWLYRIAHNESIDLVRRRRAGEPLDPELAAAGPGLSREAEARERLGRLLADLEELPERQRGALLMRELGGLGFEQIGAALGCTPAVARQTTYEARLGLREFEAGREMDCAAVTKALSDGDGRVARRRDIRAHLRECAGCSAFRAGIEARRRDLAALSPPPAALGAGLLQGVLGGGAAGGGGAGGGIGGALGAGAAKSAAGSLALKATATVAVAVVAALGVGAERGGLLDAGPGDGAGGNPAPVQASPGPDDRTGGTSNAAAGTAAAGRDPEAREPGRELTALGSARARAPEGAREATRPEAADPAKPTESAAAEAREYGRSAKPALPEAAQHGQQTAAAHRATNRGRGGERSSRTEKPARPAHAGNGGSAKPGSPPGKPAAPTAPAAAGGGPAQAAGDPPPVTGNGKKAAATASE